MGNDNTLYLKITNFRDASGNVEFRGCTAFADHYGVLMPVDRPRIELYHGHYEHDGDVVEMYSEDNIDLVDIARGVADSDFRRCDLKLQKMILERLGGE